MSLYTLRPISDRTPFTGHSIDSPFTAGWSDTLDILSRELYQLNAKNVVLEVDYRERDLRLDGMLRADAKCQSPSVRLAFESKHGPLTYATDVFHKVSYRRGGMQDDWQHNVRAIAMALEALRKVDRYGITKRGEQYVGWKAITAGTTAIGGTSMTRETALKVIADESGYALDHLAAGSDDLLADAIQRARKRTHPDKHNGDDGAWNAVDVAAQILNPRREQA